MQFTAKINGKEVPIEIADEVMHELGLLDAKRVPKTGYEKPSLPNEFFITSLGGAIVVSRGDCDSPLAQEAYKNALCTTSSALSTANERADRLMRQIRRFAALNGGIPSPEDWKRGSIKWFITHNAEGAMLDYSFGSQIAGVTYFSSREAAEQAIKKFKGELLWYFNEYKPMLYEEAK